MLRKIGNVCQSIGVYQGKKQWNKLGICFADDKTGELTIKLDALPLNKIDANGYPEIWLRILPDRRNQPNPPPQTQPSQLPPQAQQTQSSFQPSAPCQEYHRYNQNDFPQNNNGG